MNNSYNNVKLFPRSVFTHSKKSKGITLVELLVAMLIGLFIMSGVIAVMGNSKSAYIFEQELAYVQENARFIIEEISYNTRMAGYTGCSRASELSNTLKINDANEWMYNIFGVKGLHKSNTSSLHTHFDDVYKDTDILIVSRGHFDYNLFVGENHTSGSSSLPVTGANIFDPGSILVTVSANCSLAAIFQYTGQGTNSDILHDDNTAISPGNCTTLFSDSNGRGIDCQNLPSVGATVPSLKSGSPIGIFKSYAYYIKTSSLTNLPTLFRRELIEQSGNATTVEQELVSGIESMRLEFGMDLQPASSPDGVVDQYLTEDGVTDWSKVVSVRLHLILRSSKPILADAKKYDFGTFFDPPEDKYFRQKITTTVRLRNYALVDEDES